MGYSQDRVSLTTVYDPQSVMKALPWLAGRGVRSASKHSAGRVGGLQRVWTLRRPRAHLHRLSRRPVYATLPLYVQGLHLGLVLGIIHRWVLHKISISSLCGTVVTTTP